MNIQIFDLFFAGSFDKFILCFFPILASIGQKLYVFLYHFHIDYEWTTVDVPITRILWSKWVEWKSDLFPPEARQYIGDLKESVRRDFIYEDKQSHRYRYVWREDLDLFSLLSRYYKNTVYVWIINSSTTYRLYEIAHHNSC